MRGRWTACDCARSTQRKAKTLWKDLQTSVKPWLVGMLRGRMHAKVWLKANGARRLTLLLWRCAFHSLQTQPAAAGAAASLCGS